MALGDVVAPEERNREASTYMPDGETSEMQASVVRQVRTCHKTHYIYLVGLDCACRKSESSSVIGPREKGGTAQLFNSFLLNREKPPRGLFSGFLIGVRELFMRA